MTVSQKLYASFGAFLLLSILLGANAVHSIGLIGDQIHTSLADTAKKQQLAGKIEIEAVDFLSMNRGILARAAVKDNDTAGRYHQQYQAETEKLNGVLDKLNPMLQTSEAKAIAAELRDLNGQLKEIDEKIYGLATSGDLDGASKLQVEQFLPLQEKMRQDCDSLARMQDSVFDATLTNVSWVNTTANRISAAALGLTILVGLIGVVVVRQINQHLWQNVTALDEASREIASAASQVASSSQSIAQGSSEQAATIEETSASSSEINSMAQRNTENSRVTAEMVAKSQVGFEQTDRSLNEMIDAMEHIDGSSQKISQIIKVIDAIAFQTNILALNAAVEAARAGEAGMGFAVVANEVRNLAQRSAQAAKDTAGLIEESMLNTSSGKAKVDQMALSIRSITAESARMKTLIDEISLGSVEQARGIDQIARAVSQMETVTQNSAANAQEGAAAAQQLDAQARTMKDIVVRLTVMLNGRSAKPAFVKHFS